MEMTTYSRVEVRERRHPVVRCLACGGLRHEGNWPHAPRWVMLDTQHLQLDCVGREVSR